MQEDEIEGKKPRTQFGRQLKAIRVFRDMSQKELAEKYKKDSRESIVSKYEMGTTEPGYCAIQKFAAALNVSPEFFFLNEGFEEYQQIEDMSKRITRMLRELPLEEGRTVYNLIKAYFDQMRSKNSDYFY